MVVQKDLESNSWVWIGGPVLGSQILDLARSYDVEQIEMDLEFVLVLLSTDKLKSRGVSIFYQERASWLDALSLVGDAGSLRISSGGWGVELSLADTQSGLTLLSQPVIRCVEGQSWSFANDSEVPVPRSEIVDGTIRNSVDFRPAGFGLEGVVRVVGDQVLLQVEQRNGSIAPSTAGTSEVPIFNNQKLKSTVRLAFWEWSVLGGIQIDREQLRRGLFRHSVQSTSDYLVIFVRPRLALEAPLAAVPVESNEDVHPLLEGPGLLPSMRDWEREEREFLRDHVERRAGHPAGK